MTTVPILLLKGLAEGLVLAALEREPARGQDLLESLQTTMGQAPNRNQVFPLLESLEASGLLEGDGAAAPDAREYRLADRGRERLSSYRDLPSTFSDSMAELFHRSPGPAGPEAETPQPTAREAPDPPPAEEWVDAMVDLLPGAPVRAPFARVSLDRHPSQRAWTLRVEQHEPGSYEGSQACPLTFLYEAAQRLLFQAPSHEPVEAAQPAGSSV